MPESTYQVITVVGTSTLSWEDAAKIAIEEATKTLRDIRIAEVQELDMKTENGKVATYRAKVKVSFRVETTDERQFHKDPAAWLNEKEHHGFDG
jgi:dodecin